MVKKWLRPPKGWIKFGKETCKKVCKIISVSYIATDNMYVIIKNGLLFILYLEVQV